MAITYISSSQQIIGANHPYYADTKNVAGQYINTQFLVEHASDGDHEEQRAYMLFYEIGSYVGDATNPHEITLSNSNLSVLYLEILADLTEEATLGTEDMGKVQGWETLGGVPSETIDFSSTGSFTIESTDDLVNKNATTYYYFALGVDTTSTYTGDAGAGSDPDWVEDGDLLYGDGTKTSIANQVEGHIETAFLHEHLNSGVHNISTFTPKIEIGTYEGDGNDDRNITLTVTDLDIQYIIAGAGDFVSKTESLAGDNSKVNDTAAFQANYIQSVGTGTFQVGDDNDVNQNGITYYFMAIGE